MNMKDCAAKTKHRIPAGRVVALEDDSAGAGAGVCAADVEHERLWQHADGTQIGEPEYREARSGMWELIALNASEEMLQVVAMLGRVSPWPRL